jgi:hypothetical protein
MPFFVRITLIVVWSTKYVDWFIGEYRFFYNEKKKDIWKY